MRAAANLVGAAGAGLFAQATLQSDLGTHSWIGTGFLIQQTWVVAAYLIRRPANRVSRRPDDWLLAFAGTFGGVLLRPDGIHPGWGVSLGFWIQVADLVICVGSFLALGRSFGFAAADRGLVQGGPYGVVRHPIYSSYLLLLVGYLLQSISVGNAVVVACVAMANMGRAVAEERLLATNQDYRSYARRVRWRIVPGLW